MTLISVLFWILALVHLVPALAALAPSRISRLYGIDPGDKSLLVLLQHRAILLGLVGAAFASAAHLESVRWPVLIGGSMSMVGFIIITAAHGQLKSRLGRIALIDAMALPLVVAIFILL